MFPDEPGESFTSRLLSGLLSAGYVAVVFHSSGLSDALRVIASCILPVACIWFPDVLGAGAYARIHVESPPLLVWLMGWVVLLVPLFASLLFWLEGLPS
jgi:hypothetical protein